MAGRRKKTKKRQRENRVLQKGERETGFFFADRVVGRGDAKRTGKTEKKLRQASPQGKENFHWRETAKSGGLLRSNGRERGERDGE